MPRSRHYVTLVCTNNAGFQHTGGRLMARQSSEAAVVVTQAIQDGDGRPCALC
jgi:hypothetical protein